MYRVGLEAILGFKKRGDKLAIEPCLPSAWKEYTIEYRHLSSSYTITVKNPDGVQRGRSEVVVDGATMADAHIPLGDDGAHHEVTIVLRR
jgi:cyclic beta-1,2-glucan synthetase